MALSSVSYTGDGVTPTFTVPFEHLSPTHVKVYIDDVEDVAYTWATSSSITPSTLPALGAIILIKRETPTTPLVDFVDGSNLTEVLLDTATRQSLYVAEENKDFGENLVTLEALNSANIATAQAVIATAQASIATDKANVATVKASEASTFASTALGAVGSVKVSANDSTPSTLDGKIIAGSNISLVVQNDGANENIEISANIPAKATQALAEAGVNDDQYMTPLKTKQAIEALSPDSGLGVGQTWQNLTASRANGVTYTNTSGRTIVVAIRGSAGNSATASLIVDGLSRQSFTNQFGDRSLFSSFNIIVPAGSTYSTTGVSINSWAELR